MYTDDSTHIQQAKRWTLLLLFLYFAFIAALQAIYYFWGTALFVSNWIDELTQIYLYGLAAMLIWVNKDNLSTFHIDRWALFIFLVFGSLLRGSERTEELTLQCVQVLSYSAIALALFVNLRKSQVIISSAPRTGRWILFAIFVTLVNYLVLSGGSGRPAALGSGDLPSSLYRFSAFFLYHFGRSLNEEIIFRCFLWGYLKNLGLSDSRVWVCQAILFSLVHFHRLVEHPVPAGISIFLQGLLFGFFAWKSRSAAPGMISHGLTNTLVM